MASSLFLPNHVNHVNHVREVRFFSFSRSLSSHRRRPCIFLPTMKAQAFIFDLFETLVSEFDINLPSSDEVARELGLDPARFKQAYRDLQPARYTGKLQGFDNVLTQIATNLGVDVDLCPDRLRAQGWADLLADNTDLRSARRRGDHRRVPGRRVAVCVGLYLPSRREDTPRTLPSICELITPFLIMS